MKKYAGAELRELDFQIAERFFGSTVCRATGSILAPGYGLVAPVPSYTTDNEASKLVKIEAAKLGWIVTAKHEPHTENVNKWIAKVRDRTGESVLAESDWVWSEPEAVCIAVARAAGLPWALDQKPAQPKGE